MEGVDADVCFVNFKITNKIFTRNLQGCFTAIEARYNDVTGWIHSNTQQNTNTGQYRDNFLTI